MTDRRLATIETITELAPIPEADAIERARIRGWDVVVRKGEFAVGDTVVYFEVDSLLDITKPQFAFLEPRGVRTDSEGNKGHVLKTARLRGQYSQGLAIALADFPELDLNHWSTDSDVTDALGVIKWEPPVPANLAGEVRGMRPSWIPKTDEERIQNVEDLLLVRHRTWTATEKIDGSSCSFGITVLSEGDTAFHVCSRNLDLLEKEGNTLWKLGRDLGVEALLTDMVHPISGNHAVLQGEAYGEGIQSNPLKIKGQRFAAFNLIFNGVPMPRSEWPEWVKEMSVPEVDLPYPLTVDEALAQVENLKSAINPDRPAEGVVWRCQDPYLTTPDGRSVRGSWKAISTRYLLKHDG